MIVEPACDIFCSFRLEETLPLASALKEALAKRGLRLFVCTEPAGECITTNLIGCKMALILGSQTYGKQTASVFSTYDELETIADSKKPFFLVKTCAHFTEPSALLHLRPSIPYHSVIVDPMDPAKFDTALVDAIVDKFKALGEHKDVEVSVAKLTVEVPEPEKVVVGWKVVTNVVGRPGDYVGDLVNNAAHGRGTLLI